MTTVWVYACGSRGCVPLSGYARLTCWDPCVHCGRMMQEFFLCVDPVEPTREPVSA